MASNGTSQPTLPKPLKDLTHDISEQFISTYKPIEANPSQYLAQMCINESEQFRENLIQSTVPDQLTFSDFGDEIKPSQNKQNIGIKRSGMELESPSNKKRKLSDIDIESENEINDDANNNGKARKRRRRQRNKLSEKYEKYDKNMQSLEVPSNEPSRANEFFDPISICQINLNKESKIRQSTVEYIDNFELLKRGDIKLQKEKEKFVNKAQIEKYLKTTANENGYTIQKGVANIFCLGLKDHLKNMFNEMDKWRNNRIIDARIHSEKIKYDGINSQEWIDEINEKYATKQAIVETKDEIEALETEKADLDFKKMTGILTDEEEKRKEKLDKLIRNAQSKQKRDNDEESKQNQFAMKAMGGDFSFNFNNSSNDQNNNKKKKKQRVLQSDKFYVIDIINMMENHQQFNQQHLHQLAKLYRKQT